MSGTTSLKYFVGGVPSDVKHKDLYDFFKKFGSVKRVTVFNSDHNKKLFGFCFVKFKSLNKGSLDIYNTEFIFQGRKLEIDVLKSRGSLKQSVQEKHSKRVFLQNVPSTFEEDDLFRLFSPFGEIANCFTVNRKPNHDDADPSDHRPRSGKYGYVIFSNKEDAESLIRRRFVEVNSRIRIQIKRYSSTINRVDSEENKAIQRPPVSVESEEKPKVSGETLSIEDSNRRFMKLQAHRVKPTCSNYYQDRKACSWIQNQDDPNLRFNIYLV